MSASSKASRRTPSTLFSIGEGIAYGSSVINYVVSGSPVSAFRVKLSDEYFNVEFTGKDVRNWSKTNGGYVVQLHTPVAGAYTLLATYERPFKPQGETLAFTGAEPTDATSEQGYTLVISAYQFDVKPADISPGLLPLETAEVPPEYRLFFDAPDSRRLPLHRPPVQPPRPRAQSARAGQFPQPVSWTAPRSPTTFPRRAVLTGRALLRQEPRQYAFPSLLLPDGTDLWSATVNGAAVVPVKDGKVNLIPLPQRADPNAVLAIDLKLATTSRSATHISVAAPIVVGAPVMLEEWHMEPDLGPLGFVYQSGSLTPVGGVVDISGFAGIARTFHGLDVASGEQTALARNVVGRNLRGGVALGGSGREPSGSAPAISVAWPSASAHSCSRSWHWKIWLNSPPSNSAPCRANFRSSLPCRNRAAR